MNIFFVVQNPTFGSAILRGLQISCELNNQGFQSSVITHEEINVNTKNSIFIWVKEFNVNLISKLSGNYHIYDVVDNYIYKYDLVNHAIQCKIFDALIVNNSFMSEDIKSNIGFNGKIFIVPHHWDPRLSTLKTKKSESIRFGFLGSIASLQHTNNFLHYDNLISDYPIEFIDSESGENFTELIENKKNTPIKRNINAMSELFINFNCHISIRENNSSISKYKTTAKIATASALNHNIITTYEKSVADFLPHDYPFLLKSTDLKAVKDMFELVIQDYSTEKSLWNKGIAIMDRVKNQLSIQVIAKMYISIIQENNFNYKT